MKFHLLFLAFWFTIPALAQQKTAYVDLEAVLQAHPDYATKKAAFDEEWNGYSIELEEAKQEVKARMERARTDTSMSATLKLLLLKDAQDMQVDLEHWEAEFIITREREWRLQTAQLREDVAELVAQVGKESHYDRIVDSNSPKVTSVPRKHNLTKEVIKLMQR